jgi:cobaltochelatase CobN
MGLRVRLFLTLLTTAMGSILAIPWAHAQGTSGAGPAPTARVRIIADDFVLPGRLHKLARLAGEAQVALDHLYVETAPGEPKDWLNGIDLVILDTPRPMDVAKVEQRVGEVLRASQVPWIRVGGGPPAFGNLPPQIARPLIGYYAGGGAANGRAMFAFIAAWRTGTDVRAAAAPQPLPGTGFYHPQAPRIFGALDEYLQWGTSRWKEGVPRVAFLIHAGLVSGMETQVLDALVARSEARGLVPIVLWFEAGDPQALEKALGGAKANVLVIATHLQNGPARAAELLKLGIPVLQAVSYREGDADAWAKSDSSMPQRLVAPFLALPETWGVIDPVVIDAVQDGEPAPIPAQLEALIAKAARLAALRHKAPADKRIALMFWNYPPGEKNLSASNLNVPRSLEKLTAALAAAGYDVPATSEAELIRAAQAMLGGFYRPESLASLLEAGLAATVPVRRYRAWLDTLPPPRRAELIARWGEPDTDPGVRDVAGAKQFVIPRLQLGKLAILPQLPRSGSPGVSYHDTKEVPGHFYLAAYLYVRELLAADAVIHFGTHGTQEWTPGKDRGLAVSDYPYLAVGDLPVLYPYIQDNVAEAIQAKRRGRAVIISHQTPPFVPAGLYAELRDLPAKIQEHAQLDDGAVRDATAAAVRKAVISANLHRDVGWTEERMLADFPAFLSELHDHIEELALRAMPLGLHTFGEPASPEHRLMTVMQQLSKPFYDRVGAPPKELVATDLEALKESKPYRTLFRFVRANEASATIGDPALRADIERAVAFDRNLADTGEIEALLAALAGRYVAPGPGGDPIRTPDVPSGRNLFAFEPDKVPTRAAYEAGGETLKELIETYAREHNGEMPRKLAFSLWAGETMRHLGVLEAQVLHALGLRPVWNEAGRVTALEIIPRAELGRPRIDAVLQVTSVYRDQFDGFMRLLAGAIEKLAQLDEPDSPIRLNTVTLAEKLVASGRSAPEAARLASLRIFSNAPGDYGTHLPDAVLASTTWESDAQLARGFLSRLQYAYGAKDWGARIDGANLFAEQLKGAQAAVLSRTSKLHGILSTDHPFEYLGGLALAIRHLDGAAPSLYIADLKDQAARIASAARFLADEMRTRTLNPRWIAGMQKEGYAGTLELLNATNHLWGWQVTAPDTVRADQWQAVHDTFVRDIRQLGLAAWFEENNPTAQGQIIERLIEAIRKGYWDASEATRKELVERWAELAERHGVRVGEAPTRAFVEQMAAGFGLQLAAAAQGPPKGAAEKGKSGEPVRGQVLQPVTPDAAAGDSPWRFWAGPVFLLVCLVAGAAMQLRSNARLKRAGAA